MNLICSLLISSQYRQVPFSNFEGSARLKMCWMGGSLSIVPLYYLSDDLQVSETSIATPIMFHDKGSFLCKNLKLPLQLIIFILYFHCQIEIMSKSITDQ